MPQPAITSPGKLRRVEDYVEADLADDISLADLAGIAGLSLHHFGEAFHRSIGVAPHNYVMEKRVRLAEQMLRDRRLAIAEIATSTEFANQSHLTMHFRRLTGLAPARFRRLID
jgi:AraC family transcriptional regulator